jgi:LCP family protein required for cell wall assembly
VITPLAVQTPTSTPKMRFPVGKVCLGLAVGTATSIGLFLGKYAPLTAFDWLGLISGRNPTEVFIEGLATRLDRPYQILVMGIDRVPHVPLSDPASFDGRSDTIMLIRVDPVNKNVNLLAIPRDTKVRIAGYGTQKINSANVFGGAELAKTVISEHMNGVLIDRVVRLDTQSIVDLVDAMGGIEIHVPERMQYTDKSQGLEIDLQPGLQTLNGKQAEGFVRYRGAIDADLGRVRRQQLMLNALKRKLADPLIVTKLPDLIGVVQKHLYTDLSFDEMMAIASFALSVKPEKIKMLTLGGRPSEVGEYQTSYWLASPEDVDAAIDGQFQTHN